MSIQYSITMDNKEQENFKIIVSNDGRALQFIPKEKRTYELCKIAVSNNRYTLKFVPQELRTAEICEIAGLY